MSLYFSVRSRALASLVTALAQVLATAIMGTFLDFKRLTINQRAKGGFWAIMILSGGVWTWAVIIQHKYEQNRPALDWVDASFGEGWALYVFQQVEFALTYNYGYWLMGFLAKRPVEVVRYASVARGIEAAGQCVASGISSTQTPVSDCTLKPCQRTPPLTMTLQLIVSAGIILALWGFSLVPSYFVIRKIGIVHIGAEGYVPEPESLLPLVPLEPSRLADENMDQKK